MDVQEKTKRTQKGQMDAEDQNNKLDNIKTTGHNTKKMHKKKEHKKKNKKEVQKMLFKKSKHEVTKGGIKSINKTEAQKNKYAKKTKMMHKI